MFDRASRKLGLEQAVLGTFEKEQEDDKPTQQEMERLLKKGAYALLEDDNDEVTKEFCADDIESILAKRTRTRVVEGTKTASWLNKQGMVVSKSKFSAEGDDKLDMDDPLFWQKVMPDFVTPSIMLQKLNDLEDEIEGRQRGPGRGRWRKKREEEAKAKEEAKSGEGQGASEEQEDGKAAEPSEVATAGDDANAADSNANEEGKDADEVSDNEEEEEEEVTEKTRKVSRANTRKINTFMSDLKSMMQNLFEEEEEEALGSDERAACQKLLLTISVKEKFFNDEQRHMAKKFLKRFEGSRTRRCRTSDQSRFRPGAEEDEPATPNVREELMIRGKKRKKRKKRGEAADDEPSQKRKKVGEDGYLQHSDTEDDWSDVGHDMYQSASKKDTISRKEAKRRRVWAAGDDAATAAGRAWPVFPRPLVNKVLSLVLASVIKYDEEKGGVFSVPVPKDEFPEYYEQIKKPMDYGTMENKLEDGDYRSAQAMQKDFILIMQNCRKFNADSSDIVREAREQHLMRPKFLEEAAEKLNLFLAEDGSVLEIVDEKPSSKKATNGKKKAEDGEAAPGTPKVRSTLADGNCFCASSHATLQFTLYSAKERKRRRKAQQTKAAMAKPLAIPHRRRQRAKRRARSPVSQPLRRTESRMARNPAFALRSKLEKAAARKTSCRARRGPEMTRQIAPTKLQNQTSTPLLFRKRNERSVTANL